MRLSCRAAAAAPIRSFLSRVSGGWKLAGLVLLLLLIFPCAGAEKAYQFSISCPGDPAAPVLSARRSDTSYTVFLPGSWDASRITVSWKDEKELGFGDLKLSSGDTVDLTPLLGQTVPLTRSNGRSIGKISFYQGSRLTNIFIDVDPKQLSVTLSNKNNIIPEGDVLVTEKDGSVSYRGRLTQFKGRGNNSYSYKYKKKPFQFKLESKAPLGGMSKAKTWILLSNHQDLSLLRNQIVLDLSREIGMRGAVSCVQADLWLNGQYNGLYLLTEKIQIKKNRLDIYDLEDATEALNSQPLSEYKHFRIPNKKGNIQGYEIPNDPEDITGGYLLELDKPYRYRNSLKNGFVADTDLYFVVKEPTYASRAQIEFIYNLTNRFCRAVAAKDGVDPESGAYYADLMETNSFAAKFLVEDFCKNYDALAGSQYFFKDRDSADTRLYAGPCWDYDLCMGNIKITGIGSGYLPEGSWAAKIKNGKVNWYKQLDQHPDFHAAVQRMYHETLRPALALLLAPESNEADGHVLRPLSEYRDAIADSARMNFARWSAATIKGYYSNSGSDNASSTEYLFRWIEQRIASMDTEYANP